MANEFNIVFKLELMTGYPNKERFYYLVNEFIINTNLIRAFSCEEKNEIHCVIQEGADNLFEHLVDELEDYLIHREVREFIWI